MPKLTPDRIRERIEAARAEHAAAIANVADTEVAAARAYVGSGRFGDSVRIAAARVLDLEAIIRGLDVLLSRAEVEAEHAEVVAAIKDVNLEALYAEAAAADEALKAALRANPWGTSSETDRCRRNFDAANAKAADERQRLIALRARQAQLERDHPWLAAEVAA